MRTTLSAVLAGLTALVITACGSDGNTAISEAESAPVSGASSTTTSTDEPTTSSVTPTAAPTTDEAMMNYRYVETVTRGLNIYQVPDSDDYHLCILSGEAPGYEFITPSGCSPAMTYNELANAMLDSWDRAFPDGADAPGDRPAELTPPEVYVLDDNSGTDEFMECIEAGGSGATCRR